MLSQEENFTIKTNRILSSLSSCKTTIVKLKNTDKEYNALIDEIVNYTGEYIKDTKWIQEKLGIKPDKLMKLKIALYNDFLKFVKDESAIMAFQTTRVCFIIDIRKSYQQNFFSFYCRVPSLPTVGAQIDFPFLLARLKSVNDLYVHGLSYEFNNNEMEVTVEVRDGYYELPAQQADFAKYKLDQVKLAPPPIPSIVDTVKTPRRRKGFIN